MNRGSITRSLFRIFPFLFVCLYGVTLPGQENEKSLRYDIRFSNEGEKPRFLVTLRFLGDESGITKLLLPNSYGGVQYTEGITELHALTADVQIMPTDKSFEKTVHHPPGSFVEIGYRVHELDIPFKTGKHHKTNIKSNFFHFLGYGFFANPGVGWNTKINLELNWHDIPRGWEIANGLGTGARQAGRYTLGQLIHTIYLGGDIRLYREDVEGKPIYVAINGEFRFEDDEFVNFSNTVISYQRNFWNDHEYPHFLISLIEIGGDGTAGTSFYDTFVNYYTKRTSFSARRKIIVSHEIFHTWNGQKIKRSQPEQLVYWFSEGFTTYYGRLLLLRAWLLSFKEYLNDYNNALRKYFMDDRREVSNNDIVIASQGNIPYWRGEVLAHNWDARIRKSTKGKYSLDNVMFDLHKEAQENGMVVSPDNLDRLVKKYMKTGVLDDVTEYLSEGKLLEPMEGIFGDCVKLEVKSMRKFRVVGKKFNVPQYVLDQEKHKTDHNCYLDWAGKK